MLNDSTSTPWPTPQPPEQPARPDQAARRGSRRLVAAGVGAGLLAGGAIGLMALAPSLGSAAADQTTAIAIQQDDNATGTETGSDDDTGSADERPEPGAELRELLQGLVDEGTITAEQADAVAQYLVENRPDRAPGGPHGGDGPGGLAPGRDGEVVAGLIGIDAETLRTELMDGKSIATIAEENGVDPQTVTDALVAEAKTHLDQFVADGRLTQEEADQKLVDLTDRITEHVNAEPGDMPIGRMGPGRRGPGHHVDGDGPTEEPPTHDAAGGSIELNP